MKVISVERGKGEEVAKNLNFHPDTPKKSFSSYSFFFSFHCNQFKSSRGRNDIAATSVVTTATVVVAEAMAVAVTLATLVAAEAMAVAAAAKATATVTVTVDSKTGTSPQYFAFQHNQEP